MSERRPIASSRPVPPPSPRPLRSPHEQRNDTRAAWVVGFGVLLTLASAIAVATTLGNDAEHDLASAVWSDERMDELSQHPESQLTALATQVCTSLDAGTSASQVATQLSRTEGLSSASSAAFVRTAVEYTCPERN